MFVQVIRQVSLFLWEWLALLSQKMLKKAARISSEEATTGGVCWTYSPMVDISRDARWGRSREGAGEDPFLGSDMAKAWVRGYQGDDLSANNTMMACVKHFALYGAA